MGKSVGRIPKIEIVHEAVELEILGGLLMDERHHRIPDGEFVRWLNRILGRDDFFVYHHLEHGSFVLAQMRWKDPRVCVELDAELFDRPPDQMMDSIEREEFWKMRYCSIAESKKRMRKMLQEKRYEEKQARHESALSRRDVSKWLKRKGMDLEADQMERGATPHIGRREARLAGVDGMFDDLKLT